MYIVAIKSGTSGYYDQDNCDMVIAEIPSNNIPQIGSFLSFGDNNNMNTQKYLVTGIQYNINHKNEKHNFGEWIYVYVIKA